MTQSSNLPFDKFYNAFNSTGHIKNFTLDRFKPSDAKSIIEKLMQTKEFSSKNQLDDIALINEIQNLESAQEHGPIPLTKTEQKIFNEVVNLLTEIDEIKQKTHTENEEFIKLKVELKQEGIEFPEFQQKNKASQTFKRYSSAQLEIILEDNDKMQAEIDAITKQLVNSHQENHPEAVVESHANKNSLLKRQLSVLKIEIMNAGDIDDQDIHQLNSRIEELKTQIFRLEQKRMGRHSEGEDELKYLKDENEGLRLRTIELLKRPAQSFSQRKAEAIRILKLQEQEKIRYFERMNHLKNQYQILLNENARLQSQSLNLGSPQYEPLQVESKVSSFHHNFGEFRSTYGSGKENYLQNYDFERAKKNPNLSSQESTFKARNQRSGGYLYN